MKEFICILCVASLLIVAFGILYYNHSIEVCIAVALMIVIGLPIIFQIGVDSSFKNNTTDKKEDKYGND